MIVSGTAGDIESVTDHGVFESLGLLIVQRVVDGYVELDVVHDAQTAHDASQQSLVLGQQATTTSYRRQQTHQQLVAFYAAYVDRTWQHLATVQHHHHPLYH